MSKHNQLYELTRLLKLTLLLVLVVIIASLKPAEAASLVNKSVALSSVTASATASHNFQFDITGSTSLGSIAFQYCEDPLVNQPCIAPSGIDASSAALSSQSGQTGFSVHPNTTSNRIVITRPPAFSTPGTSTYNFSGIVNPDTPNHTTYVRITTYSNIDATGFSQDDGTVAFSLTPSLGVNVFVPPYIVFCVGVTVDLQCQTANGQSIDLGILKSTQNSSANTQFAGATNDTAGYTVSVLGTTMTSGNNEISGLSSPSTTFSGVEQFGLNLRDNSNPDKGGNPEGSGTLVPSAAYNSVNLFTFNAGDVIASTSSGTEYNRMTVTYLVNITPNQAPGAYSTTLTYVAVASF